MKNRFFITFVAIALLFSSKTKAQSIIARSTSYYAGGYTLENDNDPDFPQYLEVGQTFKSLLTTTISTIQLYSSGGDGTQTCDVQIYASSSPTAWGSLLNTKTNVALPGNVGWFTVDVSSLNISVTSGNYYGFKLIPHPGYTGFYVSSNGYPDGQTWTSNGFQGSADFAFQVLTNITLPVTLISFTAQKQNDHSLLQWSTATEQNTKSFIIQHSVDGKYWNNIGTVTAAGNSNSVISYSYVDANPATGINYYRLLQTDIDGRTSFSEARLIKFNKSNTAFSVIVNPVSNSELKVQVNETMNLSLYNSEGKLVWKKRASTGIEHINVSSFLKGIYLLKGNETTEKVLVQ